MKYIDGIKDDQNNSLVLQHIGDTIHDYGKHIPIIYYKPLTICFKDDMKTHFLPELEDFDNLEWVDGQPYELITLNGSKD